MSQLHALRGHPCHVRHVQTLRGRFPMRKDVDVNTEGRRATSIN